MVPPRRETEAERVQERELEGVADGLYLKRLAHMMT